MNLDSFFADRLETTLLSGVKRMLSAMPVTMCVPPEYLT